MSHSSFETGRQTEFNKNSLGCESDKKSTQNYKGHAFSIGYQRGRHYMHFPHGRPGFDPHARRFFTLKISGIFYLSHKLATNTD